MKRLLILATVLIMTMTAFGQTENQGMGCTLVAGVGCGNLVLNKTRRSDFLGNTEMEKQYARDGLTFSFRSDETLDTIVASGKDFTTDRGVHPGDEENQVQRAYGTAMVAHGKLRKGDVEIGTLGDKILCYSGVRFVIVKGKVWAIEIVPASAACTKLH